jgi:hypothetical protein
MLSGYPLIGRVPGALGIASNDELGFVPIERLAARWSHCPAVGNPFYQFAPDFERRRRDS